jgi:Type ISP C-terminal specificity domain
VIEENGELPPSIQVGYRSFDRQWLIPDSRLMERPRPPLWAVRSEFQVYTTVQHSHIIENGPGLTFSGLIPDLHHYNNRSGRVLPLYRDPNGKVANLPPALIPYLARRLNVRVSAEDVLAYTAAIVAHSGYMRRFRQELQQPGRTSSSHDIRGSVEKGR